MKKGKFLLCLVLAVVSIFGVFGLTACGETSIATVKNSYKNLAATYERVDSYVHVTKSSNSDGDLQWNLDVVLGGNINTQASQPGKEAYQVLNSTYEKILVIANDYIMSNKDYIDGLSDKDLSQNAKKSLKPLNDALNSYTSEISVFVSKMNSFNEFLTPGIDIDADSETLNLRSFKKAYGRLVSKSITLSSAVASFVEQTEVFKYLRNNVPEKNNFIALKNYIRIKLLPIFSRYRLNKIENVYDFYATKIQGDAYTRVNEQLSKLENSLFQTYEDKLLKSSVGSVGGNEEERTKKFNEIFDKAEAFFTEENNYFKAVDGIDFFQLSQVDYDSKKYAAKNKNFERYMDEIDIFLGINTSSHAGVLESFIKEISGDFNIN